MKRKLMVLFFVLCFVGISIAGAEGLLPSLIDTIGKPMPSLGEALGQYPDEEIPEMDSGYTEVFRGITETDFNTFSVYLSEKGATLEDYQTTGSTFSASIQIDGKIITFTYDTQTLEARISYSKETYDEWLEYAKTKLASAVQLTEAGKTNEALAMLHSIPNYHKYKPVVEYMNANSELKYSVGAYVTFGHYPQTTDSTDITPIEWLVLDRDGQRVLLLSRYGLDAKPYNTENIEGITWETSTLRTWLNNDFLNNAFTENELAGILETNIDNGKSQGFSQWSSDGGNNTWDKVFLLSYAEANKYLNVTLDNSKNMESRVEPTAYAIKQGANTSTTAKTAEGMEAGWWWLRSPGRTGNLAALVDSVGYLRSRNISSVSGCVRPALWINLKSDIF